MFDAEIVEHIGQHHDPQQIMNVRAAHDRKQVQFRRAHAFEHHVERMVGVHVRKIRSSRKIFAPFLICFALRHGLFELRDD